MKKRAILFCCIGEFYWECARFASYLIWKRKIQYKNQQDINFIVLTREDRFDLYGQYVDILVPLKIDGDNTTYNQNGYRLDNFPTNKYNELINNFRSYFEKDYEIIEHIYPDISKAQFCNRQQYKKEEMLFDFLPRISNSQLIHSAVDYDSLVVLAPRYRKNMKRNWSHWQELYDLIWKSDLQQDFLFMICGLHNSYVPDKYDRFLDLNKLQDSPHTSLSGLLIEVLRRARLTVGSQSAIPNLSLLFGVEVLEWGHQRQFHTIDYNLFNTPITFLDDLTYNIRPEIVFEQIQKILRRNEQCQHSQLMS